MSFLVIHAVKKERVFEVSKRTKHKNDPQNSLTIHKDSKKIMHESRELPRICRFCVSAHSLYYGDTMLCDRKGIVSCEYCCSKFSYDPLKHQPVQTPNMLQFDETLLSIEDIDETFGHPVLNEKLAADTPAESVEREKSSEPSVLFDESDDVDLPELVFTSHKTIEMRDAVSV